MIKCELCGHEFDESEGTQPGCGACFGGCHGIHCPRCNYKNIPEPEVLKRIKALFNKSKQE